MTLRDLVALSFVPAAPRRAGAALAALAASPGADPPDALELLVEYVAGGRATLPVHTLRASADEALARAAAAGIRPIGRFDAAYPEALAAIPDPPPVLWVLGEIDARNDRMVAIVGSRAASPYGLAVAERLAHGLAGAGVTVVSGMARGCDAAAHAAALAAGGRTVAVLGSGADVVYPAEHRDLHRRIALQGAVAAEWAPGTPPLAQHFPLRNRIISGLCRATVVVEASDRSGSLITAACALEQGRDVMAVPGPVVGERHRGSHGLLRDGARLVGSAEDVLEELGWTTGRSPARTPGGRHDPLLECLPDGEDCDLDTLAARSGQSATTLLSRLMELELAGHVRRVVGGRFARAGRQ
jgi:DNA processing protein